MDGQSAHESFVQLAPWVVLGVGAIAVALTGVALVVFLITHLLGPKSAPSQGDPHGHASH